MFDVVLDGVFALLPHRLTTAGADLLVVLPHTGTTGNDSHQTGAVIGNERGGSDTTADQRPNGYLRGTEEQLAAVEFVPSGAVATGVGTHDVLAEVVEHGTHRRHAPADVPVLVRPDLVDARHLDAVQRDVDQRLAAAVDLHHAHQAFHPALGTLQDAHGRAVAGPGPTDNHVAAAFLLHRLDDGGRRNAALHHHQLLRNVKLHFFGTRQPVQRPVDPVRTALAMHGHGVRRLKHIFLLQCHLLLCPFRPFPQLTYTSLRLFIYIYSKLKKFGLSIMVFP